MLQIEDTLAIPLWINGHAFLTMTSAFLDVRNPVEGAVLRRTPMCGAGEALKAVEAAQAALLPWAAQRASTRSALLANVGMALADYSGHFAGLIAEETGKQRTEAKAEVDAAVSLLTHAEIGKESGVVGVIGRSAAPLFGALQLAVPALMAGATLVVRPSPDAPSALLALAELTGQCGLPAGVFNILQGGDDAVEGLRAAGEVRLLFA